MSPLKTLCSAVLATLTMTSFVHADTTLINGAGATFPYPLYSKWISEYKKVDSSTEINYQSIGSGGGIRQLLDKTVDFGASDAPMNDEQLAKASPSVLHIPTVLGAVVLSYNIPGVTEGLKLTSDVIADIFLGKITKWNDARIASLNKGVKLPAAGQSGENILVAYRSDGSGTTAVFTDYLSKVSAEFKTKVGQGPSVKWPAGIGGKGNEGVTGTIKNTAGSVGYIELVYAETNKLPVAIVKNSSGEFVKPGVESVSAAAAGSLKSIPADFRVSITNADGKKSYPISSFTYLLIYSEMEKAKGEKLVKFLNWAIADGQKFATTLSYAQLPASLVGKVKEKIKSIKLK